MNVFYTNDDPVIAASEHCKIHARKMIVEYAQLLSSSHHLLDTDSAIAGIYKCTHKNHPSAVWCRSNIKAYNWVLECAKALCELYTASTGKVHATEKVLAILGTYPVNIPDTEWKEPPVVAPDEFKRIAVFGGTKAAYKEYMNTKFREWISRDKPLKVDFYSVPDWVNLIN